MKSGIFYKPLILAQIESFKKPFNGYGIDVGLRSALLIIKC